MSKTLSWRPKRSVKARLVLMQAVLTTFLVVILAAFLYIPTRQSLQTSSDEAYFVLANNLVATVFNSIAEEDYDAIIATAKRIEGVKGVSYVLVQDEKNNIVYDTLHEIEGTMLKDSITDKIQETKNVIRLKNSRNNQGYYEYAAPFLVNNKPAVIVRIAIAEDAIEGEFDKLREIYIKISALVLIIGVIVSYLISVKLTSPIRQLTENALAIRAGNLSVVTNIHTNDEMEQLGREFKRMVDQLKVFYLKEVHEKEKAIAERKKIELINQRLRELDRRKNEFLSTASHQLRTPLSVILWSISMFREEDLSSFKPEKVKLLEESEKSARTMEGLINELLDLSRVQRGSRKFIFKPIDIVKFAKDVYDSLYQLAAQKEIKFTIEKSTKPIPEMISDERALRHIISNIIDNAIRYTPNKGQVRVRLDGDSDNIYISVKDTGIGISKEEESRIYNQFTRGDRAVRISPDGSGLGLYLVKNLVDDLHGKINLQSEVGKGSEFTVSLPIKQGEVSASVEMG